MKKKGDYEIPFSRDGSLLHYYDDYCGGEVEWKPNFVMQATLNYRGYRRGRSAAYLLFEDGDGRSFPMFLTVFDEVACRMSGGFITGSWTFRKTGTNYSICPADGVRR